MSNTDKPVLIKFELDLCYGELHGLFVEKWSEVEKWCNPDTFANSTLYLGDVCGKHSDVDYAFDIKDFTVVNNDPEFIAQFQSTVGTVGYNPVELIKEQEEINNV